MAFQTQLLCQPSDRLYETMTLVVAVVGCVCVIGCLLGVVRCVCCVLCGGHFWFTFCARAEKFHKQRIPEPSSEDA